MFKNTAMLVLLFSLLGMAKAGLAMVSLSVSPIDGSNQLRFDTTPVAEAANKKEVHLRINSANGSRYQVYERVLEPIVNEKGDTLSLQALSAQTLPGSNSSGVLYLQNANYVGMGDQLLYSSEQAGESDGFMVGYDLNRALIASGGTYRGRLLFTVRAADGSSDQAAIDIFMQATPALKVAVQGGRNPGALHVHGSDTTLKAADFISFSFSGNSGQQVQIYQEVDDWPQNEAQEDLNNNVLQLDAEGQTEGLRIQGLGRLNMGRTLVYSSNKDQDSFNIYFLVDAAQIQQQGAGIYTGRIKYVVQTGRNSQEFPFDLRCDVPAIFTMNVTTPQGGVAFTHVLAGSPPQDKDVLVTVQSNLHKPYQVLQDFQTNMTNEQGKEFDSKYFTIQVQIPTDQKGRTDFVEFAPVQTGEHPIFSSDSAGSGATFKVDYRLQGYQDMSPGEFLAPIRLSLEQK